MLWERSKIEAPAPVPGRRASSFDCWRLATGVFALFVSAVILAANLGSPLLGLIRYVPGGDFTGHLVLIGTLAFLANGWAPQPVLGGWLLRGSAVVALLVLLEELSQGWLPQRSFSLSDLAADALGIALADGLRRWLSSRSG